MVIYDLSNISKHIEAKAFAAVEKACLLVEGKAKEKCPSDTGILRSSIMSDVKTEQNQIVGTVGTMLEYAPFIEYGTGLFAENGDGRQTPWYYQDKDGEWHYTTGMPPHPFLRPALKESANEIKRIIAKEITK